MIFFQVPEVVGSVKVELQPTGGARVTWGSVESDAYQLRIFGPDYDATPRNIITRSDDYILDGLADDATYRIQVSNHNKKSFFYLLIETRKNKAIKL